MNIQCSLIQELVFEFEQGHKAAEVTKNICCTNRITKMVKKKIARIAGNLTIR